MISVVLLSPEDMSGSISFARIVITAALLFSLTLVAIVSGLQQLATSFLPVAHEVAAWEVIGFFVMTVVLVIVMRHICSRLKSIWPFNLPEKRFQMMWQELEDNPGSTLVHHRRKSKLIKPGSVEYELYDDSENSFYDPEDTVSEVGDRHLNLFGRETSASVKSMSLDPYGVLGVDKYSTNKEIKRAYWEKSKYGRKEFLSLLDKIDREEAAYQLELVNEAYSAIRKDKGFF